nr:hypothetical protein [Tanacetum cinerariifolium]
TLPVEVGVAAAANVPFVTSSVTPDSIFETGLRTQHPAERFLISSDSSYDLNVNATDHEVAYVIRSSVPPPPVLTAAVATTVTADATFALVHESGTKQVQPSIFRDFASPSLAEADVVGLSQSVGTELLAESFYLRGMDYEQLLAEFNVGTARQVCFSAEIKMQLEHELREAAEAIRLRGQITVVEAAKAAWANELNVLKERNVVPEGQVVVLESVVVSKDVKLASSNAQVAKVTQDFSSLQLSCDELSARLPLLNLRKTNLLIRCLHWRLHALASVMSIDYDLMEMALHMDEEFYPRYLTTIVVQRWILCHGSAAGFDHGKAGRALVDVFAYNLFAEADYVAAINALRVVDFPFLAQLESRKDASMADIMDLLRLEGPVAETLEASQLSRIRGDVAACRLSLTDAMVPLIEPLSVKCLTGEASTLGVLAMATTTALSTTFIQASTIPLAPSTKVPFSPKIVFEQEELNTTPEHTSAS